MCVCVCIYIYKVKFFKFTVLHFKWNEETKELKNGKEEGRKEGKEGGREVGRKENRKDPYPLRNPYSKIRTVLKSDMVTVLGRYKLQAIRKAYAISYYIRKVCNRASLLAQLVKNLPAMQETPV